MPRKKKQSKRGPVRELLAIAPKIRDIVLLARVTRRTKRQELFTVPGRIGTKFLGKPTIVKIVYPNGREEKVSECSNFLIFSHGKDHVMTYVRESTGLKRVVFAGSKDFKKWIVGGEIESARDPGVLVPGPVDGNFHLFTGGTVLRHATSKDLKSWSTKIVHDTPSPRFLEGASFVVIGAVLLEKSIAVFCGSEYRADIVTDSYLADKKIGERKFAKVGVLLFDRIDPSRLVWQSELPLCEFPLSNDLPHRFLGVFMTKGGTVRLYSLEGEDKVSLFEFGEEAIVDPQLHKTPLLVRFAENPIIKPDTGRQWELDGTFNPAAIRLNDMTHILYRAVGSDGASCVGYAASKDGYNVVERLDKPAYVPREAFERNDGKGEGSYELFFSGGSWGGCEDPKLTELEGRIYMTYVAHPGYWPTRTALTSISKEDFLKKRWQGWARPMIMSSPSTGSKSACILPAKINEKYVIFHRIWPRICVDLVDSLEFGEGKQWLSGDFGIEPRPSFWDSRKLSIGAPPIKTNEGWLAIYNAVDKRDGSRYHVGAMLLDESDPTKVIARSRSPLLSPDEPYENEGKPGVVYPGGTVIEDGTPFVYYGGGDKVVCVATSPLEELLWHLLRDANPTLTSTTMKIT